MEKIININLKERNDYINKYNKRFLSYELRNYILEELKGINPKTKIKFSISSDFNMEELEKNNLIDMIRTNFGADISEIITQSKKQNLTNLLLLLIGSIFITISIFTKIKILSQFSLIFGWVILGESICNFFYKTIENKHKISRRKQIVKAKAIFEKKETNNIK